MQNLPAPSLFGPIFAQARLAPHEVAVITPTEKFTYKRFCSDIDKATRLLHAMALPPTGRIAVVMGGLYLHFVVTLALSRLGLLAATCPIPNLATLRPDVVITDTTVDPGSARLVKVSREWIPQGDTGLPPFEEPLHEPDAPSRIVLSSGTTGVPKLALFSKQQIYERMCSVVFDYGMTRATRELCLMGTPSIGGFVWPVGCWMAGGTVLLTPPREDKPAFQLLREKPNMLFASTAQLDALVESLPADFDPQHDMTVYVAGSVLPRALNRKARMRLSSRLMMVYGSTEVGTATLAPAAHVVNRPGLTGYVHPPCVLEIVDEQGRRLPNGTVGEVRMHSHGQAQVYLDDAATSAQTFRDVWFYPGDLGMLGAVGDLYIKGRVRELMNFGGVKVTPDTVDELLADTEGVADLASFSVQEGGANDRLCVAVVATEGFKEEAVHQRCREGMPELPPVTIVRVAEIPRNEMGKIQRLELAKKIKSGA